LHGLLEGYFRGDRYVHKGLRPVAAEVAHSSDFTVGDGNQRAAGIAQNRAPQREILDASCDFSNLDCITYGVLVFEHDIKAGNHVPDEILSSETDGDAGQAGEGQGRRGVNANFVHGGQEGDKPDDLAASAVKDGGESARLLFANLRGAALRGRGFDHQFGHHPEKAIEEQSDNEDGHKVKQAGERDFGPVNGETGHRFFGSESITLEEGGRLPERAKLPGGGFQGEVDMSETRRRFLTGLAGAGTLLLSSTGMLSGQSKPKSNPIPTDPTQEPDNTEVMPAKSATKAILEENQKDIKKSIEKLFQLASDLKAEVEKTDSSQVLSLSLVRKAEEIERLAHDIKSRAKG